MPIHIFNTLSGKKEEFKPIKKGHVSMYTCGPTVYDTAHIGNLRTFVMNDIFRRVFEYEKYIVTHVMNSTDVDDKTIKRSKNENKDLMELTRHYENLFLSDTNALNITPPHRFLRATEHIKEMIEMISILLEKGIAYPTRDGIYFSIGMFPEYGKLAKIKLDAEVRERIINDEYEKENPRDFALWKFWTEEDGGVVWDAPFGKGRPGWHIECSAMATWALGHTIDVHTGGTDLIFPHHTNEIAQSEAATGEPFVHYWLHTAFMNVNEEKMAKSKGNFIRLNDITDAGISPLSFRYWLLTAHYRTQINFTLEAVQGAQNAYIRLLEIFMDISLQNERGLIHEDHDHHAHVETIDYKKEFEKAITDDFNTSEAIALIWKLTKDYAIDTHDKYELFLDFDRALGLGLSNVVNMKIPDEINALSEIREEARKNKEWDKADALRKEIEERGYEIKDTEEGVRITKRIE